MDTPLEQSNLMVIPTGLSLPVGNALPAAIQRIVRELQPEKSVLFGSYAYGNPTPDSDVDLLVIMETDLPSSQRYVAVSRLINPRPFPVDIIVKRPDEMKSALEKGDLFLREIITRGVVLYDRHR